jgi:hypothetical protein
VFRCKAREDRSDVRTLGEREQARAEAQRSRRSPCECKAYAFFNSLPDCTPFITVPLNILRFHQILRPKIHFMFFSILSNYLKLMLLKDNIKL